jgi:hypothetical protein
MFLCVPIRRRVRGLLVRKDRLASALLWLGASLASSILWILASFSMSSSAPALTRRNEDELLDGFALSFFGGVQTWDLGTLEDVLELRSRNLAVQGFALDAESFGWQPAFGVEFAYHFRRTWLARVQGEWTRFESEVRSGKSQLELGGGDHFVSVGYTTRVETRFFLGTIGVQRASHLGPIVLSWGGGIVIAPIRIEDEVDNWIDTETSAAKQKTTASGVGVGLDLTVTVDYLLEGSNTIFVDTFYRNGSTSVELDQVEQDGAFTPGVREVEFSGVGVRLGLRWL